MTTPLRVLLVEDSEDDALLILRELRRGGYEAKWDRVDTPEALRAALARQSWDLITCDYVMPHFSAPAALRLIQQHGIDVPIIIVSGEVDEEIAVTAMKGGAHDYVSKHKLTRLVPAIERELREAEGRRARRHAEDALAHAQQRMRTYIEEASDLIFTLDASARVTSANRAAREATGYSLDELSRKTPLDLVAPESLPAAQAALQRILAGGSVDQIEVEILGKNGQRLVLEIRGRSIRDGDDVIGTFHIARDITERRRAEAERARLVAAVEQAAEAIVITDPDGTIVYVNPAGEQMTGYSRAELLGQQPRIFGDLPQNADARRERQSVLAGGEVWRGRETRQRKDGSLYVVEMVVSAVTDTSGRRLNYVALGREVTEDVKRAT